MPEVTLIEIDIAKTVFHLHGATSTGPVAFRKKLSRSQLLAFLQSQPPAVVVLAVCATAHRWGREILKIGADVRLIPPIYLKPVVKRQTTTPMTPRQLRKRSHDQRCALGPVKGPPAQS